MYTNLIKYRVQFIIAFALVVIFLLFLGFGKNSIETDQMRMLDNSMNEIKQYASSLDLELKLSKDREIKSFWLSDDGYGIRVPIYTYLFSPILTDIVNDELKTKLANLTNQTIKILKGASYTIDELNTSRSEDDYKYGSLTTALKSSDGTLLCSIRTGNMTEIWSLSCITKSDLSDSHDMQLPFLRGLSISKFSGVAIGFISKGDYARVGISDGETGYYAIMKKVNNEWTVLYQGQDKPSCDVMKQNNVPRSIYEQCH